MLYAAADAYKVETGRELPAPTIADPDEPAGTCWHERDLARLFPKLSAAFL